MELLQLYAKAEEITKPLCLAGEGCGELAREKYHCCAKKYCDMAALFARDGYGVALIPTGHAIPFMGEHGCTVPIHLRPVCTLHACAFSWAGKSSATEEYLNLRNQILTAERETGREIYG